MTSINTAIRWLNENNNSIKIKFSFGTITLGAYRQLNNAWDDDRVSVYYHGEHITDVRATENDSYEELIYKIANSRSLRDFIDRLNDSDSDSDEDVSRYNPGY